MFDRAEYDRLRVLSTELKRLAGSRDDSEVEIILGPGRRLNAERLARALAIV